MSSPKAGTDPAPSFVVAPAVDVLFNGLRPSDVDD
ncbi:MAG: hypothetical protein QOF87_3814 [Pseudonocardiales bacterium]|nr:hypothetical protein [Pseudonocardiales bacterium]MDT4964167.1 hypothetical protein [Pseudonocardiales bacterium]MDT4977836.1 hypothetical protein [Pseudonocardiales bacterium]